MLSSRFASTLFVIAAPFTLFAQGEFHFHHVHLNSTDPAAAAAFYVKHFSGEPAKFAGADAVWTQRSWLLFNKVKRPPPSEIVSALYHIGWSGGEIKSEFQRQIDLGTTFQTLLTDAVDIFGGNNRDRAYFFYVDGPDHAIIELQTAVNHDFSHVHLLSDDPVAAAEWYQKEFGMMRRNPANRNVRIHNGIPTGPSASLTLDNVNFFWFPTSFARALFGREWENRKRFESPRGRVIDHFAVSVDRLDERLARLRRDGVKIVQEPRRTMGGAVRSAFVAGPDGVEIEIVEGHASKP